MGTLPTCSVGRGAVGESAAARRSETGKRPLAGSVADPNIRDVREGRSLVVLDEGLVLYAHFGEDTGHF